MGSPSAVAQGREPSRIGRSALRLLRRIPRAALEARPLELDMRRGPHGGDSSLAKGLDQRVKASSESGKLSLSPAPHNCLTSRRTTYHGIPPPKRNVTPRGGAAIAFARTRCPPRRMAERDRLQPGEPVAADRATQEDRRLVVDQLAAEADEDRWPIDQARSLLLAALGGEPSHATLVWSHAGQDRSAAPARGVGERPTRPDFQRRAGRGRKGVAGIGREGGGFVLCYSRKW